MTQTNISELNFFEIKTALIEYFQSLPEFTDYNFEGSALDSLLDVLAYNAHYTGAYTNLGFSESFLDTAVQRANIVSRASELGYTPRSTSASVATIRLSFTVNGNPNQYVLPKNTKFLGNTGSVSYNFVTTEDILFNNDGNDVFTKDINIHQGIFTDITYTNDFSNPAQKFELGTDKADTRFITVSVKDTESSIISTNYICCQKLDVISLSPDSPVFYLKENYNGVFEVYFGDGVISRKLENNNFITINYLITEGKIANGINNFTLSTSLNELSNISITTLSRSNSGDDKQSTESVAFQAPLAYQAQNRAVTETDYITLLKSNYSGIDDLAVWGGEKNDPPFYGKVFIAIKPTAGRTLTNSTKQIIQNDVISKFNIVSVRPEIVDPDYIEVEIDTTVTYNSKSFDRTNESTLEENIKTNIEKFFSNSVNGFTKTLYYSKLISAIDDTSTDVINSITNLRLSKSEEAFLGTANTYTFKFNNSIFPGAISSNSFVIDGITWKIRDRRTGTTSNGTLEVFRETENSVIYLTQNAGTVDYNLGIVTVENLRIDSILNDSTTNLFTLTVSPGSFTDVNNPENVFTDNNVYTNERDQIIRLKDNGITVTLLPDEVTV